ncbi:MAG: hypothetical protein V2B18_04685 [Pseudomonadota bacterium]
MLKSYEAVCEDDTLTWVHERPSAKRMRVLVTVPAEEPDVRTIADRMAALDQTKGCVRPGRSIEEIDADIREMRAGFAA